MPRTKQVALAIRVGVPYLQNIVEAILRYGWQKPDWQISMGLEYWPVFSVKHLRGWQGDGVIAWANSPSENAELGKLKIPVVNISGAQRKSPVPRVCMDDYAVGQLAARHLLDRGHRRLAHYTVVGRWSARQREAGFVEEARRAGVDCRIFSAQPELSDYHEIAQHEHEISDWLRSLQTPVGIFAFHDYRARKLIEVCRRIHLLVPDDVAVVGVNNDPALCEHVHPPLTSVERNGLALGTGAAELLDHLMSGMQFQAADVLIPPQGIVARLSTDVRPTDDPLLAAAVRLIRERCQEQINIEDIIRRLDVSRRTLERSFQAEFGTTPHAFLTRLRIEHAKHLLTSSAKTPLQEVAQGCGFSDARTFRKVFLRIAGVSPRQFRSQHLRQLQSILPGSATDVSQRIRST